MSKSYYYSITDDIAAYPDAWCIVTVGGRSTGKTYGALKDCYLQHRKFIFAKRTNKDIDLLCAGSGAIGTKKSQYGLDLSPFKSINRDLGCNVKAFKIADGLGGFWECEAGEDPKEGIQPAGDPIGILISLNAVSKFAGFDMSDCAWLIFDEFIPRPWEKVNRKEGDQLMDLYKTVSRDREHRGRPALKLICLANAVSISNPVSNILEVTDTFADMQITDREYEYIEDRGILLHKLKASREFEEREQKSAIYRAMHGTDWAAMAFENSFAYNDFTAVQRGQLKGYKPVCSYIYKHRETFIYQKDGQYRACSSRFQDRTKPVFNLAVENDQKRFYYEFVLDLRNECINGNMKFESYTMYDLIINYHRIFTIR